MLQGPGLWDAPGHIIAVKSSFAGNDRRTQMKARRNARKAILGKYHLSKATRREITLIQIR